MFCCLISALKSVLWYVSLPVAVVVSLFLIALRLSHRLNQWWFCWFSEYFGPMFAPILEDLRKTFLQDMHVMKSLDADLAKENALRVLEVGVGSGANLKYYPKNTHLTPLDNNPNFAEIFEAKKAEFPNVVIQQYIVNSVQDMKDVESDTFDAIVCTHLLCSVTDPIAAVKEIKRVLVKGGKLFFIEHVGFPTNSFSYKFQVLCEPIWSTIAGGCRITRNTRLLLEDSFSDCEQIKYMEVSKFPFVVRPHIFGNVTK